MSTMIFLAVLAAHDGTSVRTLYYASGRGFTSAPTDTPANTFFAARLKQPVSIRRDLFSDGATRGRSQIALGELVLNNADGALDALLDYGFDGRDLKVYLGPSTAAFPGGFQEVFVGTMEQPESDERHITIRVRDRQYDTKRPLQSTLYAGSNVLPAGLEGTADDLKGKPKPLLYGRVHNAPAVLVNSSQLIYQLHDGALSGVSAVYDKGAALAKEADYPDQATMESTAPSAGAFRAWPAGGYFRLGSSPAGTITADATEGAAAADRTVGQIFRRILLEAGVAAADIDGAAITALDTFNGAEIGIFVDQPRHTAEVLDEVAGSIGAWWGQAPSGLFTAAGFTAPSGTPAASFTGKQILRLKRVAAKDAGGGLPAWRVVVRYLRNYSVQAGDALAGSVTAARRGWLSKEYRDASAEDGAVRTKHLLAPTLSVDTLLTTEAAASAEASRLLALRKVRRDCFEARVKLNDSSPQEVTLNAVVQITYSRFGLSSGELFRVISAEPDSKKSILNLILWG